MSAAAAAAKVESIQGRIKANYEEHTAANERLSACRRRRPEIEARITRALADTGDPDTPEVRQANDELRDLNAEYDRAEEVRLARDAAGNQLERELKDVYREHFDELFEHAAEESREVTAAVDEAREALNRAREARSSAAAAWHALAKADSGLGDVRPEDAIRDALAALAAFHPPHPEGVTIDADGRAQIRPNRLGLS